jgi:hypothetical protein
MRIAELTQPQKVNVAPLSRKLVGTMTHEEVADIVADQFPDVQVIIRNSPIYDMGPDMAITTGFYDPPTGDEEENIGLELLFDSPDREITWNNKNRKQFIRSIQDTLHHELLHKDQERSRQDRGYDRESERGSAYARDKSQPYFSVDDEIEAFALNSAEQLIRDARNDKQRALEILRNARNAEELKNKLAGKKGSDLKRYLDSFKPGDPTLKRFLKKVVQFIQTTESIEENFADGKKKGKSRPGRVKRAGASCKGSVTDLKKRAKKYSGERGKMYQWCLNMKRGRKKGK